MSENFDPYLKWLGIRSGGRKVNHYRLLGLTLLESEPDIIRAAADRQIGHVMTFSSDHPEIAKKLIKELTAARDCLLDSQRKKKYDLKIKQVIAAKKNQESGTKPAGKGKQLVESHSVDTTEFSGINVAQETPSSSSGAAIKPQVRARTRRKKNPALFDFAGWILGAVAAVVFAWFLLNSNLADNIRQQIPFLASQDAPGQLPSPTAEPDADTKPKAKPVESRATKPVVSKPVNSKPKPTPGSLPEPLERPAELPVANRTHSTKPFSAPNRQPVPEKVARKAALETIKAEFKSELSGRDSEIKELAARRILRNVNQEQKPEVRYASLLVASQLSAQSGNFDLILDSINHMKRLFEGDGFWTEISKPISQSMSDARHLEKNKLGLEALLTKINQDEQFDLSASIVGDAENLARKSGDMLQAELFGMYAKDLRGLASLKKKFVAIESKAVDEWSAKEKSDAGRYLCFGKGDWQRGLQMLSEGSDKSIANVAKLDLAAENDDGRSIAQSWSKLSQKSKYKKILDRRFFLERARSRLEDSNEFSIETRQLIEMIQRQTAVFKNYVGISELNGKSIEFDVKGWATFDRAALDGGILLKLGLNSQVREIPLIRRNDFLTGTTRDRKLRFEIRAIEFGVAELQIFDSGSNTLRNVLYGN